MEKRRQISTKWRVERWVEWVIFVETIAQNYNCVIIMMKKGIVVICLLVGISLGAYKFNLHPRLAPAPAGNITDSIAKYHLNTALVKVLIVKHAYQLSLIIDGHTVKNYPVVLGPNPVDDKKQQGDGCTPEGFYKIRAKYPHQSWSYFLWIDYPNAPAWARFNANKKNGVIKKDADIGGEVGIHGVPFVTSAFGTKPDKNTPHADNLIDMGVNWTAGCISLKTADIIEIYKYVPVGAEVEIQH